jgi:hypothetical protein
MQYDLLASIDASYPQCFQACMSTAFCGVRPVFLLPFLGIYGNDIIGFRSFFTVFLVSVLYLWWGLYFCCLSVFCPILSIALFVLGLYLLPFSGSHASFMQAYMPTVPYAFRSICCCLVGPKPVLLALLVPYQLMLALLVSAPFLLALLVPDQLLLSACLVGSRPIAACVNGPDQLLLDLLVPNQLLLALLAPDQLLLPCWFQTNCCLPCLSRPLLLALTDPDKLMLALLYQLLLDL